MSDTQLDRVSAAIDTLLAEYPPATTDNLEFRGRRYDAGLAWVHFPEKFGGLGVRPDLNRLVEERCRKAGAKATDASTFFMALAGPTIGTRAQVGQVATGTRLAEQLAPLFFAGLATKAVRDGDEWIVNGQKVWNTLAHLGDWGMLVTRTDPEAPKHKGMTYFALDMKLPGVEVRPLRQITGEAEFNEVYMTDTRVPDDCRIGAVGEGWRAALTT